MDKKDTALKILKILKKEYLKYQKPVATYFQETTKNPFKVLISTILSPRAKDTQTEKVSIQLFKIADTPEKLLKINYNDLQKIIYSIGFYKIKTQRIKNASRFLLENYNGKVPNKLEELLKIPGVGRKVANIVLAECFGQAKIAIDTHCMTISNRLGFAKGRNPLKVEESLERIFPKNQRRYINRVMVVHGQNICLPISPKCSICPVNKYCQKINVKVSR